MRRAIPCLAITAVLLGLASCGGGGNAGGSVESAVRYLPADAAQVFVISTDLDGDQWRAFEERLGQGELAPRPTDDQGGSDGSPAAA